MVEEKKKSTINSDIKKLMNQAIDKSMEDTETKFIETGNIGFDLALSDGRGIPVGSSTLLWSEQGVGKTTILGDVCRRLLDKAERTGEPHDILYLATENSKSLLEKLGLKKYMISGNFIYVTDGGLRWRDVERWYDGVLLGCLERLKNVKTIIIDSINNVNSDASSSKSIADGDYGTKARERYNFYGKYLMRCYEQNITSFFIAQARNDQDATMFTDPKKVGASYGDKHNVEIILKCGMKSNTTDAGKVKVKTVFNNEAMERRKYIITMSSSATGCKNRYCNGTISEALVIKGVGIDNSYAMRKLLESNKYIKSSAGWYSVDPEIATLMGVSSEKMRLKDLNDVLREKMAVLVEFLKKAGQYKLDVSESDLDENESFDDLEESEE